MYKFMILVACLVYANAGVITGEHSLVGESLALNSPLSYAASAPIVRSSLNLGAPILGSSPLTLQAQGSLIRSAPIVSAAPAQLIRSAPLALHVAPQQTIVRSAPLALNQGGLLDSAELSYGAPAASIFRSAPLDHGSLNIVRSAASLALQAAPALSYGSLNIVRSAPALSYGSLNIGRSSAPALSYGSLNIARSSSPLALQADPALSHGSLSIIRSAPLSLNAGW